MGLLIVLPIAAAIAILDRRKIEEYVFLAIGIVVSIIFATGYMGSTLPGVYAGVLLGVVSVGYCLYVFIKDRGRFREHVMTPGLLGGVICFIIMGIIFWGGSDYGETADTYRTYAPRIINMYRYNELTNSDPEIVRNFSLGYTAPITESWCYFCNKLWFYYSDGINTWARGVMLISALLPFYSFIRKNEWQRIIIMSVILFGISGIFVTPYRFLHDVTVANAAIYGMIMSFRMYSDKEKYNDIGYIAACCWGIMATCMLKRIGGIFLFGIVGPATMYTIDRIRMKDDKTAFFEKIMPILCMFMASLVAYSFRLYTGADISLYTTFPITGFLLMVAIGIYCFLIRQLFNKGWHITALSILGVTCIVAGILTYVVSMKQPPDDPTIDPIHLSEIRVMIFWDYYKQWFTGNRFGDYVYISDFLWTVLVFGGILTVKHLNKNKRISLDGHFIINLDNVILPMFMGYLAFVFLFCYIYTARYGVAYEFLLDYYRYLGPGISVLASVIIYVLLCIKGEKQMYIMLCIVASLVLLRPNDDFLVLLNKNGNRWNNYESMCADAGLTLTPQDKVLYVAPDPYGDYALFPAKVTRELAVHNGGLEVEEWSESIIDGEYKYLVIEDSGERFNNKYQEMFEGGIDSISEYAIYDIIVDGEEVRFRKK